MTRAAMDLLTNSDLGTASVLLTRDPRFKAGALLLEMLHVAECPAPPSWRWVASCPDSACALLLDERGRDRAKDIASDALTGKCLTGNRKLAAALLEAKAEAIEAAARRRRDAAGKGPGRLRGRRSSAWKMIDAEIERLTALAAVRSRHPRRRDRTPQPATGAAARGPEPHPPAARCTAAGGARLIKPIPSSGQPLPVIGMGTWITFNVGEDAAALAVRRQVLDAFFAAGGGMIDSSPMYGSAEAVLGRTLPADARERGLFSATKVWTGDGDAGPSEIETSRALWRLPRFDLLQVHNCSPGRRTWRR
jgi:hypothetical protein